MMVTLYWPQLSPKAGLGGWWDALNGNPGPSTELIFTSLTVFPGHRALLLAPSCASSMQQPLPLPHCN